MERRPLRSRSASPHLWGLLLLVIVSPWLLGGAPPLFRRALTLTTLLLCLAWLFWRRKAPTLLVPLHLWPLGALLALFALQLVPLPAVILRVLAPGSHDAWHPASSPVAAALFGEGWRPLTVAPIETVLALAGLASIATLVLLSLPHLRERRCLLLCVSAVAAGGALVAVYGLVSRVVFGNLLFGRYVVPTVSPFGPFVNKNHFAGYVVMAAVLSLGVALGALDRSRGRRQAGLGTESADHTAMLFLASFLACALAACVSLSRGGFVGLAAGIATLLLLRQSTQAERPRHLLLLGLLVVGVVGVGMFAVIPSVARERLKSLGRMGTDISARYRLDVWRDTLRMSVSSPLWGQGLGAYATAFPRYKGGHGELYVEHAENEYLEVLAEGGLLGLGLLGLGLCRLGRSGVAVLHDHESRLVRGIVAGALAGMAALLAQNLTDFNFRMPSSLFLFAFLAAVAASQGPLTATALSVRVKVLAGAALLSLLAVSAALLEPDAGPARRSVLAMARGPVIPVRLERARTLLEQQLQRMPLEAELWLLLSWTRLVSGRKDEARELARYSERLDPQNPAIRFEVRRLLLAVDGPR